MGYAFSNNGLSFRAWDHPDNLKPDEVYFEVMPDQTELETTFPGHLKTKLAPLISSECRNRIFANISDTTQRNITAYIAKLIKDQVVVGVALTDAQKADIATADAIFEWISGPTGMVVACRGMIAAGDSDFTLNSKWPAWDASWSELVGRF